MKLNEKALIAFLVLSAILLSGCGATDTSVQVTVTVKNSQGQLVEGASVTILKQGVVEGTGTTDATGTLKRSLATGEYTFRAVKGSEQGSTTQLITPATSQVTIKMQPTQAGAPEKQDTTERQVAKQGIEQSASQPATGGTSLPRIPGFPKLGVGQMTDLYTTIKGTKGSNYEGKLFAIKLVSIDKNPQGELQVTLELYEYAYAPNTNQALTKYVTKATIPVRGKVVFIDSYFKDLKTRYPIISDKINGDDIFNYGVTKQIGLTEVNEAKKEVELYESFQNLPSPEDLKNEIQSRKKTYFELKAAGKLKSYSLHAEQTTNENTSILGWEKLLPRHGSQKLRVKLVSTVIPGEIKEVDLVGLPSGFRREKHTKVEVYVAATVPEKKDVLLYTYEPLPETANYFDVDLKNNSYAGGTKNHVYLTLLRSGANTDTTNELIVEVETLDATQPTTQPKKASTFTFDKDFSSSDGRLKATAFGDADIVSAGGGKTSAVEFLQKGGSKDYLVINDAESKRDTAYTVAMWVKPESTGNQGIFVKTNEFGPLERLSEQLRLNNRVFEHYTYDGFQRLVRGNTTINDGQWYHVAITAKNNGKARLYVNGKEEGTTEDIKDLWNEGDRYYVASNSAYSLGYFEGYIDYLAIYREELTAEEIAGLFNSAKADYIDYCTGTPPTCPSGSAPKCEKVTWFCRPNR